MHEKSCLIPLLSNGLVYIFVQLAIDTEPKEEEPTPEDETKKKIDKFAEQESTEEVIIAHSLFAPWEIFHAVFVVC